MNKKTPLLILLILVMTISCKKYKVLKKLKPDMYHFYHVKSQDSEVIITKDTLVIGNSYRLKDINIIDSPYYSKKKK